MGDPGDQERHAKTRRLPDADDETLPTEPQRTARLSAEDGQWEEREPINPGWRSERTSSQRSQRRGPIPASPQEFQLWLQTGGWRYIAMIGVLLVVLLIALLAFARTDQREAGLGFEQPGPTAAAEGTLPANGDLPVDVLPTVTPAPTPAQPQRFVVTGTGAEGLFLRPQPSIEGSPLATLPDGTTVEQIGADVSNADRLWRQVRAPDGLEGYVAADFLTPVP